MDKNKEGKMVVNKLEKLVVEGMEQLVERLKSEPVSERLIATCHGLSERLAALATFDVSGVSEEVFAKVIPMYESMPKEVLIGGLIEAPGYMFCILRDSDFHRPPISKEYGKETRQGLARLAFSYIEYHASEPTRGWMLSLMMEMGDDVDELVLKAIRAIEQSENAGKALSNLNAARFHGSPSKFLAYSSETVKCALEEAIKRCEARQRNAEVSDLPIPKTLRNPPAAQPEPKKDKVR